MDKGNLKMAISRLRTLVTYEQPKILTEGDLRIIGGTLMKVWAIHKKWQPLKSRVEWIEVQSDELPEWQGR
jgi:hypothetical protein